MQLWYMTTVRFFFHYLDTWPYAMFDEKVPAYPFRGRKFLFVMWTLTFYVCAWFLITSIGVVGFIELAQCYITIFLNCVGTYRATVTWRPKFQQLLKQFVTELHLLLHQHKSKYYKEISDRVHSICLLCTRMLVVEIIMAVLMFNIPPIVNNYRAGMLSTTRPVNGTFEPTFNLAFPYVDTESKSLSDYIPMTIVQVYLTVDCTVCLLIFDCLSSLILFHVWGHIKILIYNLNNVPVPKTSSQFELNEDPLFYSSEEDIMIKNILKENIEHHIMINQFLDKYSLTFGSSYCALYLFHQVSLCILLFACSELDASSLSKYGCITFIVLQQLIQMSVVVELVTSEAQKVMNAVYSVPWERMSASNRKMVAVFLLNAQNPMQFKAMGMVPVGVQTMAAILKTSFSYFMLLRTFAVENEQQYD
ncbi:unnamed protein product [Chilo suppressalis]|uniref:Odorant receptor n=1 Tax=Chilo suppressalis TaxID=168631 RepID=A0ABN8AX05_CHISP|nr:unnamed protein product [Chilo suppressalis]